MYTIYAPFMVSLVCVYAFTITTNQNDKNEKNKCLNDHREPLNTVKLKKFSLTISNDFH